MNPKIAYPGFNFTNKPMISVWFAAAAESPDRPFANGGNCIKFRPIKPHSPHLNGKVERSQMTDKVEFYPTADLKEKDLALRIEEWQSDYNWHRPHSSLGAKTPLEKLCELSDKNPFWDEVIANYNPLKEQFQERDYKVEMQSRN